MAKHEVATIKKQDKTEKRERARQQEYQPVGEYNTQMFETFAGFNPAYQSNIDEQAQRLASIESDEQRASAVSYLQQTYGNRYVQRVMEVVGNGVKDRGPATLPEVSPEIEEDIGAARGGGETMPDGVRRPMEESIEADFSGVRVHRNRDSHNLNQALEARAFTIGQDIFFGEGEYNPGSPTGRQLLAHELTHTIQQGASKRIARMTGMIVAQTDLRKPNKKGKAPARSLIKKLTVGPAIMPGEAIELLDTKYPEAEPKWQLAKHPETGMIGFVRISKVLSKGATPPEMEKIESPEAKKDKARVLVENVGGTSGALVENVGGLIGSAGGSGTGMTGEIFGGMAGLTGMVLGMYKLTDNKADLGEKIDKGLGEMAKGALGAYASGLGMVSQGAEITKAAAGEESFVGQVASGVGGMLAPVIDAVKTVKSLVETVVLVIKGIGSLVSASKTGTGIKKSEVVSGLTDFTASAVSTIGGAIKTAAGVFAWLKQWLNMFPGVSTVLGVVGSVIEIVGAIIEFFKNVFSVIKARRSMKESKDKLKEIEGNREHIRVERNMRSKLKRMFEFPPGSKRRFEGMKQQDDGKPDIYQAEGVVSYYEAIDTAKRSTNYETERDLGHVKEYLVDRHLLEVLQKRINRFWAHVPEYVLDFIAVGTSFIGGLANLAGDIATMTGVGAPVGATIKAISGTVAGCISAFTKLTKMAYTGIRVGIRWIKQKARDWGWAGTNQNKTTEAKEARYKRDTIRMMYMVADLKDYDPEDEESRAVYDRVKLRLEATGVNLTELFAQNGQPIKQAGLIYDALKKRE